MNPLNAPQQQAVEHGSGPLLVFAGAGSGKTSTITRRIAHLVERGVDPSLILAVTFTNKAAGEMEERLASLIGDEATDELWLGTFHATGARILRALAAFANRRGDFSIYDEHDQLTVVKQVLNELGFDPKAYKPSEVRDRICKAKEKALSPEDLLGSEERLDRDISAIWSRYEAWLEASNAFDFEDLLLWPMRLAEGAGEAGYRLKNRFQHVLVDEFQDTSHTQWRFVKAMGEVSGNIMVVGDDDQCHPAGTTLVACPTGPGDSPWRAERDPMRAGVTHRRIEDLRDGDLVYAFETTLLEYTGPRRVRVGKRIYDGPIVKIVVHEEGFKDTELHVTPGHFVYAKTQGPDSHPRPLPAGVVEVGDWMPRMNTIDGSRWQRVSEISQYENKAGFVYSLDVEELHTYAANGIIVHNCIYEWRSADVNIIRGFDQHFPNATVVKLEQNYRSTGNIVAAALDVIKTSKSRVDKRLWTEAEAGVPVRVVQVSEDREEATYIAGELKAHGTDGAAVLYRTHQIARVLEEALISAGLPYVVLGGPRFYDRKEVRDVLAYLRLVQTPESNVDLLRAINVPSRGIGAAKVARLQEITKRSGESLWKATAELASSGELRPKEQEGLRRFREVVYAAMSAKLSGQGPGRIAHLIIEESGYLEMWQEEAKELARLGKGAEAEVAIERGKNVVEILNAVRSYEEDAKEIGKRASLEGYLERVALMTSSDKQHPEGAAVLMTIHAAKGLEFDRVYVAACEEGNLPLVSDFGDTNLDEERRLMYVAITRARRELSLSWSKTRYFRGKLVPHQISRFLEAISPNVSVDFYTDIDRNLREASS